MPIIDDFDDDEDEGGGSGGGSRGSGAGGARLASASPQQEQAFVPWARFTAANQDVSNREAGKLQSDVMGGVDAAAKARDDASKAQAAGVQSNYVQKPRPPTGTMQAGSQFGGTSTDAAASSFGKTADSALKLPPPAAPVKESTRTQPTTEIQERPTQYTNGPIEERGTNYTTPPSAPAPAARPPLENEIDHDRLKTTVDGNTATTGPGTFLGSKDLEAQLGADKWASLLGQTQKAQGQANALGSVSGVQGLVQQRSAAPLAQGGAFDAALLSGAGGSGFRDTAKQFGGSTLTDALGGANQQAQGRWSKMIGDAKATAGRMDADIADATAESNRLWNEQQTAAPGATTPNDPQTNHKQPGYVPAGYKDFDDWMQHPGHEDLIRAGGQYFDPLGGLLETIPGGPQGIQSRATDMVENSGLMGVKSEDITGSTNDSSDSYTRLAMMDIEKDYGHEAAKYVFSMLSKENWDVLKTLNRADRYAYLERIWKDKK